MIGNAMRMRVTDSAPVGQQQYASAGSGTFVVPTGVTSICVVVIGGGAGSASNVDGIGSAYRAGSSGALCYRNNVSVTPGQSIAYTVGGGGAAGSNGTASTFSLPSGTMTAGGGVGSGTTASSSGGDVNRFGGAGYYTVVPVSTPIIGQRGRASYAGNTSSASTPQAASGGLSGGAVTINGVGYASCLYENSNEIGATLVGDVAAGKVGAGGTILFSGGVVFAQSGEDGGIRIIWGTGRSYPSNAA